MSNILWSGLNILVFVLLLYVFFRAVILVKQYLGTSTALLFIFGLLLVSCRPTASLTPGNVNLLTATSPNPALSNASSHYRIPLGIGNQLQLLVEYNQAQGVVRPRGLYASVNGLLIGHTWEPVAGQVRPAGQQLHYLVVMQHDWKLLGWPVYSAATKFTGAIPLAATI